MLGLSRGRSKFSFLIRRWGNQVQTLFYIIPSYIRFVFSMNHLVPRSSPNHLVVLLLMFRATYGPFLGPGWLFDLLALSRTVPASPCGVQKCCLHSSLTLKAVGRSRKQCWFLLRKLSLARFGGSHRKAIHSVFPQTFFASVGLSTSFAISHPKSPVPGEGVRRCRNVLPPTQGCFSPSQTKLL